jgi:glycosyltransferase involved in cell wall biosynthesis
MKTQNNFLFIANAAVGTGLSGSDRIFIELAKNWAKNGNKITLCVWEDGYEMSKREGIPDSNGNIKYDKWFIGNFAKLPFLVNYFFRIVSGLYYALVKKQELNSPNSFIYACSDFWQDILPACVLKARYPHATLIGSYYLTAPNPFNGFYEGRRVQIPNLKSVFYWLQQQPVKYLLKKMANIVFVTSEPDAQKFKNTVVVRGGVNIDEALKYTPKYTNENKQYDAVFLGRFHPQKGVFELVDIWEKVVAQKPTAKLLMLGDGPLMSTVKEEVESRNLAKNIILKGYVFDGEEKNNLFKNSKIVVHPAVYDSGGMASAEAMAWGIPGVSFDLEALKTYYPKGMLKVTLGDHISFANKIIELLDSPEKYKQLSQDARALILENWGWNNRSNEIMSEIQSQQVKQNNKDKSKWVTWGIFVYSIALLSLASYGGC